MPRNFGAMTLECAVAFANAVNIFNPHVEVQVHGVMEGDRFPAEPCAPGTTSPNDGTWTFIVTTETQEELT